MQDYLFNEDLAKEVKAGGKDSVENLHICHRGMKRELLGYDYRLTTDTEKRFTGTAWQTGRIRSRLRCYGKFIFIDESRSAISTCGFCFWNVIVIDQDGKSQVVLGAMTMSPSNDAVYWLLLCMVSMVNGLLSDLGKQILI